MVSVGQKLKMPKTPQKPFDNDIRVVLCKGCSPWKGCSLSKYSLCKIVNLGEPWCLKWSFGWFPTPESLWTLSADIDSLKRLQKPVLKGWVVSLSFLVSHLPLWMAQNHFISRLVLGSDCFFDCTRLCITSAQFYPRYKCSLDVFDTSSKISTRNWNSYPLAEESRPST